MSKIYLVPSIDSTSNIWMYCNYARFAPHEERCLNCDNVHCQHKGKHTVIERKRESERN